MRIFNSLTEAVKEAERDLWEMGVLVKGEQSQSKDVGKAGWTKEILGHTYSIPLSVGDDGADIVGALRWFGIADEDLPRFINYITTEHVDRTHLGGNPGLAWKFRPEYWKQHLEPDGKFSYTYGERLRNRMAAIVSKLEQDPYTRQAILPMWWHTIDNPRTHERVHRVPCSMYFQFLLRENKEGWRTLNVYYSMRSCDLYTHFIFDAIQACKLGLWVIRELQTRYLFITSPGRLIHSIGSFHAYVPDLEKRGVF